jgi:hypothetical protein
VIFLQVMMKFKKNHRNQIKTNGRLLMFIKHQVPIVMVMMMKNNIIVNDLGRRTNLINQIILFFRSPDNRDKHSQEQQESNRKKCTPITSKSQLKSMVLSRFRMEK